MKAFALVFLFLPLCALVEGVEATMFVYHLNASPDLLDPAKCDNQRCRRVMWPIYESLVDLSQDSKSLVPGLAESWTVSPDGLTYTFHLRKNVKFHDGTSFTAEAAKMNLERNYVKESPGYTADPPNIREKALRGLIDVIKVQDTHMMTITLKKRKVQLLYLIPMASPAAFEKDPKLSRHPVGTGPFKFDRWTQGDKGEIVLAANPDYWGSRPKLDQIVFKIIPSSEKALKEFEAGRIDFIPEVEPVHIERIVANSDAKLIRVPTFSTYYLGFRTDRPPFNDVRLRRAVTRALDVERTILFTSRGTAVPAYGPIPPGVDGYDPDLKTSRHNPEEARRLLSDAGAPKESVSLLFNAGWGFFAELAQAIESDLRKVGITVNLVPLPGYPELVSEVRAGRGDLFLYNWFTVLTDPEVWLDALFETNSSTNLTRYTNPAVDKLLAQARVTSDDAKRLELYRTAQKTIVGDAPMVFLFHEVRVSACHTRVAGLELNAQSYPIDRFARIEVR